MSSNQLRQILVVDDESSMRELVSRALGAKIFCEVTEAESARDALVLLRHKEFHLIISDLSMTDSGLDILHFLTFEKINTPFILFSGVDAVFLPHIPQLVGFVAKPNLRMLVERVSILLEERR